MSPLWREHRPGFSIVLEQLALRRKSARKQDRAYFSPMVNLVYAVKIRFDRGVGIGPFSVRLDELPTSGALSFGRRVFAPLDHE